MNIFNQPRIIGAVCYLLLAALASSVSSAHQ